jgi:DNA-binding response OmpR family regulator
MMQAFVKADGNDAARVSQRPPRVTNPGRTIGLIEDDEDLRSIFANALRQSGYEVVEHASLSEAFAALERNVPDALLLDRELPDGSGLDLARWIRRRRSCDRVTVIGFSGRKTAREIDEALGAGCDAFIAKPCAPAIVIAEIEALLAKPRARRNTRTSTLSLPGRSSASPADPGRPERQVARG